MIYLNLLLLLFTCAWFIDVFDIDSVCYRLCLLGEYFIKNVLKVRRNDKLEVGS